MVKVLNQVSGKNWVAIHADSVEAIAGIPDNSIQYAIESPPFSGLFVYSASQRDMGNSRNDQEFYEHFCYLVREKFRVMKPGRLVSQHVMNLPTAKWMHGYIGIRDFRGELIRIFLNDDAADMYAAIRKLRYRILQASESEDMQRVSKLENMIAIMEEELQSYPGDTGFIYHSETCCWKDPVLAQQRTNAIGLLHKQVVKDSSMSRQGLADYLVTFRKPGQNPEPIAGAFGTYYGEDPEPAAAYTRPDDRLNGYSIEVWQRYASPVWMDINFSETLNGEKGKKAAREDDDSRHICPLALSIIRRAIQLWSNPGDVVMTNFGGIGSEAYVALQMGRKAIAMELKESYFNEMVKNLRSITESQQMDLLELLA